ncbi:hypothetical protein ABGT92_23855 [Streptomyces cinereoruber]|uniref:hypothetical protein n=1 Tax=Streptomyces cinereoruber TaxID=67260 RepID=UPI00345CC357
MAQLVIVEPGDILVIGSQAGFDEEQMAPAMERLKALLDVPLIVVMDSPVDLGVVRRQLIEGGGDAVAGA